MGDKQVTLDVRPDMTNLVLEMFEEDSEQKDDHWSCWDCCFDVCGNGGYAGDEENTADEVSCEVCSLMDQLDNFTSTPCKHCGSDTWAIPKSSANRVWEPVQRSIW